MAHFEDLSVCDYFGNLQLHVPLLAVGWLGTGKAFPVGNVPAVLLKQLLRYRRSMAWDLFYSFGSHVCELCPDPLDRELAKIVCAYPPQDTVQTEDRRLWKGYGYSRHNVVIPAPEATYVAPEGIIHYIVKHHYTPPQQFWDALRGSPPPGTAQYYAALGASGWPPNILQRIE